MSQTDRSRHAAYASRSFWKILGRKWALDKLLYLVGHRTLASKREKKNFQNVTSHSTLSVPKKEPTSLGLDLQFCKTLTDRNAIPWVCIRHSSSKEMQFTLHDRCCSYRLLHPRRKIIAEIYLERERIKMSISKSNAWTGCEDKENAHSHIQLLFKNRELKKTRRRHC